MKYFFAFSLLFTLAKLPGQDTAYFKTKEKLVIQLLEVNPDNIRYKRWDNQAGATYTVLKTELEQIVLSNGKKEVFGSVAQSITKADTAKANPSMVTAEKAKANDTLYFRSGKKQAVVIYDLTPAEVKYKPISNPEGPVYRLQKSDLKEIRFASGMKQTFGEAAVNTDFQPSSISGGPTSMMLKGTRDAKANYKNGGGSVGTGVVSFIFPPAGLITAIACSSIPPKQHNLGYPDDNLWQNKDYRASYSKEAWRLKRKKVWTGFGIGTAATILLYILLSH